MVYYRHLPTYKEHATHAVKADSASESSDIVIDIL